MQDNTIFFTTVIIIIVSFILGIIMLIIRGVTARKKENFKQTKSASKNKDTDTVCICRSSAGCGKCTKPSDWGASCDGVWTIIQNACDGSCNNTVTNLQGFESACKNQYCAASVNPRATYNEISCPPTPAPTPAPTPVPVAPVPTSGVWTINGWEPPETWTKDNIRQAPYLFNLIGKTKEGKKVIYPSLRWMVTGIPPSFGPRLWANLSEAGSSKDSLSYIYSSGCIGGGKGEAYGTDNFNNNNGNSTGYYQYNFITNTGRWGKDENDKVGILNSGIFLAPNINQCGQGTINNITPSNVDMEYFNSTNLFNCTYPYPGNVPEATQYANTGKYWVVPGVIDIDDDDPTKNLSSSAINKLENTGNRPAYTSDCKGSVTSCDFSGYNIITGQSSMTEPQGAGTNTDNFFKEDNTFTTTQNSSTGIDNNGNAVLPYKDNYTAGWPGDLNYPFTNYANIQDVVKMYDDVEMGRVAITNPYETGDSTAKINTAGQAQNITDYIRSVVSYTNSNAVYPLSLVIVIQDGWNGISSIKSGPSQWGRDIGLGPIGIPILIDSGWYDQFKGDDQLYLYVFCTCGDTNSSPDEHQPACGILFNDNGDGWTTSKYSDGNNIRKVPNQANQQASVSTTVFVVDKNRSYWNWLFMLSSFNNSQKGSYSFFCVVSNVTPKNEDGPINFNDISADPPMYWPTDIGVSPFFNIIPDGSGNVTQGYSGAAGSGFPVTCTTTVEELSLNNSMVNFTLRLMNPCLSADNTGFPSSSGLFNQDQQQDPSPSQMQITPNVGVIPGFW